MVMAMTIEKVMAKDSLGGIIMPLMDYWNVSRGRFNQYNLVIARDAC
jgi:hypothetical protein